MKKVSDNFIFGLFMATTLCLSAAPIVFGQVEQPQPQVENLAFKVLQKQAAEYERAITESLTRSVAKYIPESRFHLTARIYWNPTEIDKLKTKNKELKKKPIKLPGFRLFINKKEESLDYYLGAGSVLKLKVEVLIDDKLSQQYTDFIYKLVPIQARFVPERGDMVNVVPVLFPEAMGKPKLLPKDVPLAADDASLAVLDSIKKGQKSLEDIKPVILYPVLQRYVSDYEEYINQKLTQLISEYVERKNFLLNARFYWNSDEINKLKRQVVKADTEGKTKLPGFEVYLEDRDSIYQAIANSTTLMRMEISVMLDESVNPDVEPFLSRLIPMAVKFRPARGDRLTVYRGHFPRLDAALKTIVSKTTDEDLKSDAEFRAEIDQAFEAGEYRRGIVLLDLMLAKTASAYSRISLLKKKGTLHLLLQEKELAQAAWNQVKEMDPNDKEVIKLLEYIK